MPDGQLFSLKRGWGWVRGEGSLDEGFSTFLGKKGVQKGVQNDPKKGHFGPLFGPFYIRLYSVLGSKKRSADLKKPHSGGNKNTTQPS